MEGSTKALNSPDRRGGFTHRPCVFLLAHLSFLILAVTSCSFSQSNTVWIVEKPEHLVVYDAYQQSLGSNQTSAIRPFEPIKVLKARDVLGDRMTPCSKVEVGDQIYYLLLNERGHLAGSSLLGAVKVFRNVRFIDDTIEVLRPGSITYREPVRANQHAIKAGDFCVRYFSYDGSVYAKVIGSTEQYGWLHLLAGERGRSWRLAEVQQSAQGLSPMIRDRVLKRINQANLAFLDVYAILNQRTNRRTNPPRWFVQSSGPSLVCTLLPDTVAQRYSQSIQALSATLQTYILGTGYGVVTQGNRILIRP